VKEGVGKGGRSTTENQKKARTVGFGLKIEKTGVGKPQRRGGTDGEGENLERARGEDT